MLPAAGRTVLVDTRGKSHDINATLASGKQVAFVFWQPWCTSCKAEAPVASQAATRFSSELEVIGVVSGPEGSVDEDAMKEALFSWGMTYPSIRDTSMELTNGLGIEGAPTIVIVNPDGSIAYNAHVAPEEWGHRTTQ
ncbi:Thiol-disulfide oxidoreductase ResA [Planctomycetes bacterium Poly30]|uniref:Thiol-disulfide oxidoreductase ResA n=2 Tax=Saltatorellus ferox TaxID=2528018 RepID=A0A518END7_9BACT|nr:Thiol-disulfide oxidoreductase ResA [Planctomycetes bacterium Poly30]